MRKAATVLVLGDPGSIRDELLLRREIDIVWAASFEDALALLQVYRVEACIVSSDFENLGGYETFQQAIQHIPCLVGRPIDSVRSRSIWPAEHVEPVLAFLARHTGLVFARYPRAALRCPVVVEVHGEQYHLETVNISVSGVAIRGFPKVPSGTRAELCIELPERPIYLLARVVRFADCNGEGQAGLSFTDLQEGPRSALARCVDEALPDVGEERMFGELEIPMPQPRRLEDSSEIMAVLRAPPEGVSSAQLPSPPPIRSVAESQNLSDALMPRWFDYLAEEMSDIERLAAAGRDAPEWAHKVLRLRIDLARARAEESGELPPSLVDEAYRTFAGLEKETADAPLLIQQQVSSIRASLLRDVLGRVV